LPSIYYAIKIGYRIEAHLKDHYQMGQDELVLGKILKPKKQQSWENAERNSLTQLEGRMFDSLVSYCDNINKTFFENIRNSLIETPQKSEPFFIKKGRKLFTSEDNLAIALTVPKRGGCVKIAPLVLSGIRATDEKLIASVIAFYQNSFHKLYSLLPVFTPYLDFLKSLGFVSEGIISEPYKKGVDIIVMSLFI
jgi:hypothetical protein